jgi:hypothetical protein
MEIMGIWDHGKLDNILKINFNKDSIWGRYI